MSLVDYLVAHRTPMELAKEVAAKAKEIASLKDEVDRLKYELFWHTKSSARAEEVQSASRYRWARLEENANLLHHLIMQGQHGVGLDRAIDLIRSTYRDRCLRCKGQGLILAASNSEWAPEIVSCPTCNGTGITGETQ